MAEYFKIAEFPGGGRSCSPYVSSVMFQHPGWFRHFYLYISVHSDMTRPLTSNDTQTSDKLAPESHTYSSLYSGA